MNITPVTAQPATSGAAPAASSAPERPVEAPPARVDRAQISDSGKALLAQAIDHDGDNDGA